MKDVVIVGALRTPIGCFRGALAGHSAVELGSLVVKALIERTGVPAYAVDEVILGQVLTAGAGQNPARQSAIKGGLPNSVSAITINDVCGSGLKALHLATQAIQCGEADIVIAGGQENMSRAPHVLTDSRTGAQLGNSQLVDSLVHDGLWDAFNDYHIGVTAENLAREYGISRQLQDAYALSSQQKARAAIDAGRFKDEIVPVMTQSNGQTLVVDTDEQPRTDASAEGLARLNPSFDSLGSVTAGECIIHKRWRSCGNDDERSQSTSVEFTRAGPHPRICQRWCRSGIDGNCAGVCDPPLPGACRLAVG